MEGERPWDCPHAASPPSDQPANNEDLESENDAPFSEFWCPFCFAEYDIGSLCSHLEEDHCSETRSVVCPVCRAKAGSNVVGHIMLQHSELFKRRRCPTKPSTSLMSPSTQLSLDPLISNILSSFTLPESEISTISLASMEAPLSMDLRLPSVGHLRPEDLQQQVEAATRANFVQQMVLSAIFRDM